MTTPSYEPLLGKAQWQRDFAEELITGRGDITVEYFDTGVSRRIPWNKRPQARQLLNALAQPNRPFDAIVIGEFERAFYADQYTTLAPVFTAHGIQVWLPELDGPVDPASELHMSLLAVPGHDLGDSRLIGG